MGIKNQILFEAFKLFHKYGIKSVTMEDIAKDMAISKKTLYKHYTNKEALVFEIAEGNVSKNECKCRETFADADNAIHELMQLMLTLRELFGGMNPALLYDLQKYYPKAWKLVENHQNTFIKESIEQNLKRGITEGLYRTDINVGILAKLRLEEVRLTFNPETFANYPLEEVQVVLLEHFMMGITTLKGYQLAIEYKNKINE